MQPDSRIISYLGGHHLLTFATSHNNKPYCASIFYVFLEDEMVIAFMSDKNTKHIRDALLNNQVAGTIAMENTRIAGLKGIQFTGEFYRPESELLAKARKKYSGKFPMAEMIKGDFWVIKINFIKMTDNRLGFGKKIVWARDASAHELKC